MKDILEKDDFYFYITRGNKLYKKIDQCYKRVREGEVYRRKGWISTKTANDMFQKNI